MFIIFRKITFLRFKAYRDMHAKSSLTFRMGEALLPLADRLHGPTTFAVRSSNIHSHGIHDPSWNSISFRM